MGTIIACLCSAVQCFQPIVNFLAPHADYIYKFEDNLVELETAWRKLTAEIHDLERKVIAEENKGPRRLEAVCCWLSEAKTVIYSTSELVATASPIRERLSTHGFCSINSISAYNCGKKISTKLDEFAKFNSQEVPAVLTRQATLAKVVEQPTGEIDGLDKQLHSTWVLLNEDDTRILGLYGMGGVGKTRLLTQINSKFAEDKDKYDVVILVKVSKDVDIGRIQDDIGKRLGLYDEKWGKQSQEDKSVDICTNLRSKKPRFVLLLDDLWEPVSFTTIGIPLQGGEYKIVFTTRSKEVSGNMGANKQKEVECLGEDDALDLLMKNARREGLSGEMHDLSKDIAKKCHGLPLALEIIGKCLSSRRNEASWRDVLDSLGSSPILVGTEIFVALKVSYDYLENKEYAQSCFNYCALFPMAYNITQDELVEYWIGEGIIDLSGGRVAAKIQGVQTIETLVGASLLLKDDRQVHMHNMIREMALFIVSKVRDGKRFLVKTDAGLTRLPSITGCTTVSKMSLMNNKIESITDYPHFPNLVTLFLQNNKLVHILGGFFLVLSTLVVLDLSRNLRITELPDDISKLVSLRYLNLSWTRIKHLGGLKGLIRLIHLDLEFTSDLQSISIIAGLVKLQVLRFYCSAPLDRSVLESLEALYDLELLTITVREVDAFESFLGSNKLRRCTQGLHLVGLQISGKSFAATFGELESLSKLEMIECDIIETETQWGRDITPTNTWFSNLSAVVLISCMHLKDVTWLIYAANLESLSIHASPKMEEVIREEKARDVGVEPFLKLQVLVLGDLVELASIYRNLLSFPRLQKVDVANCPKLLEFPLNSTSVRKIGDLIIKTEDGWRMELKSDSVL